MLRTVKPSYSPSKEFSPCRNVQRAPSALNSSDSAYTLYNFIKNQELLQASSGCCQQDEQNLSVNQLNSITNQQAKGLSNSALKREKSPPCSGSREKRVSNSCEKIVQVESASKYNQKQVSVSPPSKKASSAVPFAMAKLKPRLKTQAAQSDHHQVDTIRRNVSFNGQFKLPNDNPVHRQQSGVQGQQLTSIGDCVSNENLLRVVRHNNIICSEPKQDLKESFSTSNMHSGRSNSKRSKGSQNQNNSSSKNKGQQSNCFPNLNHSTTQRRHVGQKMSMNYEQQIQYLASQPHLSSFQSSQANIVSAASSQRRSNPGSNFYSSTGQADYSEIIRIRLVEFIQANVFAVQTDESHLREYFARFFSLLEEIRRDLQHEVRQIASFIDPLIQVLKDPIEKLVQEAENQQEQRIAIIKDFQNQQLIITSLQGQVEESKQKHDVLAEVLSSIEKYEFRSPMLEKLFAENTKLKEQSVKAKAKLREIHEKENKINKLLYFIRKEGVDVDTIYKQYVLTPRREDNYGEEVQHSQQLPFIKNQQHHDRLEFESFQHGDQSQVVSSGGDNNHQQIEDDQTTFNLINHQTRPNYSQ